MTTMMFAAGDDWEGIYIDGKLEFEGHSIDPLFAARIAISKGVTHADRVFCDLSWLHDEGCLPHNFDDVKRE